MQTLEVNLNENMAKSKIHRYYKNVDCSRQIISQKSTSTTALVVGTLTINIHNKTDGAYC
jgi:hypothetical protein